MTSEQLNVLLHEDSILKELQENCNLQLNLDTSAITDFSDFNYKLGNLFCEPMYNTESLWMAYKWLDNGYDIRPFTMFNFGSLILLWYGMSYGLDVSKYAYAITIVQDTRGMFLDFMHQLNALDYVNEEEMNFKQHFELFLGLLDGVDVSVYFKPEYQAEEMHELRLWLTDGLDVKPWFEQGFGLYQLEEIRLGLEHNLDVSLYAKITYTSLEMNELRTWLKQGLDVHKYLNYNNLQKEEIRQGLEQGLDISFYDNIEFKYTQMREIRLGLKSGLDVSKYADRKYTWKEMSDIRHELEKELGLDKILYLK